MTLSKTAFRENCIKILKNQHTHNKIYNNSILNKKLLKHIGKLKHKNILFYYPMDMEADIRKTLYKLRKKSNIFLPFMQSKSFKMVPFRLPLRRGRFGIYEARNSLRNIKNIDIAIVPVVGVDGNLQRIGFGKGMYDRFFFGLKCKPYTIFIQAKTCKTDKKVCDDYDISCNLFITPKLTLTNRNVAKNRI